VGGINKFSGLINREAVCGKGRGREREGNETVLLGTWGEAVYGEALDSLSLYYVYLPFLTTAPSFSIYYFLTLLDNSHYIYYYQSTLSVDT